VHVGVLQTRQGNPMTDAIRQIGVPVTTLDVRRLRQRGSYGAVRNLIERTSPDVTHTHLEFANILGTLAAHHAGVPSVATLHTLDRPTMLSRARVRFELMTFVLRLRAELIVSVSECARSRHVAYGLPASRTIVIRNATDAFDARPLPSRSTARALLSVSDHARVVTAVSVFRPEKGLDTLIEAAARLRRHLPDLVCVLVGDGPHREHLEACAREHGVAANIRFVGWRDDVGTLLSATDVFVHPSLIDALPTSVMEAMAAGLPIVAARVGGVPEMIEHDVTGSLVPAGRADDLADSILRMLTSPDDARRMGDRARERAVAEFHPTVFGNRLISAYERLVARA
jgi:glycosyltransferase involved in cell wall biosynthesis